MIEIFYAENIHELVSGIHDTWLHGTRCAPPGAGAPVRAAPQCSAGLFSSMILTVLNAFLMTNTYGNCTNFI